MAKIIRDGQTLTNEWDGTEFGDPVITFKFRRALPESVFEYQERRRGADGKAQLDLIVKLLLNAGGTQPRLVEWDMEDGEGKPYPINDQTLRNVCHPSMILAMADAVQGYTKPLQRASEKN